MFEAYDYFFQVDTVYQGYKAPCLDDEITVMLRCDQLWVFSEAGTREDAITKSGLFAEIEASETLKRQVAIKYVTWKKARVPKYFDPAKWHAPYDSCAPGPKGKRQIP